MLKLHIKELVCKLTPWKHLKLINCYEFCGILFLRVGNKYRRDNTEKINYR